MVKKIVLGVSVLVLFVFAAGCAGIRQATSSKAAAGMEGLATREQQEAALKGKEIPATRLYGTPREPSTPEEKQVFETIYFDFDKSEIRPDSRVVLEKIAVYLKKYRRVKISFEGHCDERGTAEYNMALGERRSISARRYLVALGIAPERLGTVSYGAERPIDPDHNETAWAKNRRCEFKIVE